MISAFVIWSCAILLCVCDAEAQSPAAKIDRFRRAFAGAKSCPAALFQEYREYAAGSLDAAGVELLSPTELGTCPHAQVPNLAHVVWGHVTSGIVSWDGAPVFAASVEGQTWPYELAPDGVRCLLTPEQKKELKDWSLYRLVPAGPGMLLLLGRSKHTRMLDEVFLFRRGKGSRSGSISNLTNTRDIEEVNVCADARGSISFSEEDGHQLYGRISGDTIVDVRWGIQRLGSCAWLSDDQVIGIATSKGVSRIVRCGVTGNAVQCMPLSTVDGLEETGSLEQLSPGRFNVIARRKDELFRGPWILSSDLSAAAPLFRMHQDRDIVQVEQEHARVALFSRYAVRRNDRLGDQLMDDEGIVTSIRQVNGVMYGAYSDATTPRTIARYHEGRWIPFVPPRKKPVDVASGVLHPREVWLRYGNGMLMQGFYFGADDPKDVVIWWHGGPKENVSPRYNSYYHFLNEQGFGVLAVNFPGSAGRGKIYEDRYSDAELSAAIRATVDYLRANGAERIISWSISNAGVLQAIALRDLIPLSGVVDQVSNDPAIRPLAESAKVPYFSIRGLYDDRREEGPADFVYPEHHDITEAASFKSMALAVLPFLDSLPKLPAFDPTLPEGTKLLIDEMNPNLDTGQAGGLATELAYVCLRQDAVAFTRPGTLDLQKAEGGPSYRNRLLEKSGSVPRLELRTGAGSGQLVISAPCSESTSEKDIAESIVASMVAAGISARVGEHEVGADTPSRGCRLRVEGALAGSVHGRRFDGSQGIYVDPVIENAGRLLCPGLKLLEACSVSVR